MSFRSDDRGAAIQVGAIILFAFVIIAITAYQASVVPNQNNQIEYNHNQELQSQLQDLEGAIGSTSSAGERRTVTVDLGTEYPARTIFVNPPNPSGRLETVGTSDPDVNFTVANAVATNEDANDFWDGTTTHNYTSGSVVYRPNYNVYSEAPTTIVEHSLVYNVFRDGTKLTVNSQSVFDGDTISLVALRGDVSEQSGTVNVNVRPVSSSTQSIRVENATGENVNVSLVTRLSASEWRGILLDDEEFANQTEGGHVVGVSKTGEVPIGSGVTANVIKFELERDVTYTFQLARVGVGDLSGAAETTDPAYAVALADTVTTDENVNATVTVEVRDKYNNPKAGVTVNATAVGPADGNIVDTELTTGADGRVTFTYNTTENIDGSAKQDEVRVSVVHDPTSNWDASAPENVTTRVTVRNTDGSGTGSGGGGGGSGAYAITFDDAPAYNWNVDATGSTLTLTASTNPALDGVSTDFAVNDSSVAAISPEDGETDGSGDADVTLNAQANGTVAVYVASAGSSDVINVSVTGVEPTDNTPPTFSGETPSPGSTVSNDKPTMSVDVSDGSGIDTGSISVTVEDSSGTTHLSNAGTGNEHVSYSSGTITIDPSGSTPFSLADGTVDVTVEADDTAGNTGSTSWSFTVDTTGPTLTNPSPDGTTTTDEHQPITLDIADVTSSVDTSSISVTVTDADGTVLSSVGTGNEHVSYSGGTLTIDPTAGSTQFAWANGSVSVTVSASDSVGNSNSREWSFTVDASAPTAISVDSNREAVNGTLTNVSISYTELNPSEVTIRLFDGNGNSATFSNIDDSAYAGDDSSHNVTIDLSNPDSTSGQGIQAGTNYSVEVTATDAYGQTGTAVGPGTVNVTESAAGQVQLTPNVDSAGSSGKYTFELENTGSKDVTITHISVNSTSTIATEVSRNGNGATFSNVNTSTTLLDTTIPIGGSRQNLLSDISLTVGQSSTFEFFRFRDGNSNVDMRGETITITVFFSDGSSQTITMTVPP